MKTDKNKGITNISYNHLNLPTQVSFGSTNKIQYAYDATGIKLVKKVTDNSTVTNTSYAGNYIYEEDGTGEHLKFFSHSEGYVEPDGQGNFKYIYQYKDHLGNIRLSYSDTDNNGVIDPLTEILQERNYYPFGLKHKGYNYVINGTDHPYGYNGKEEQDELGLQWLDFHARNYDPALGRWMNVDPLAEQYRRWSPYSYCVDNPIRFTDPDGMSVDTELFNTSGKKIGEDANGNDGTVSIIADDKAKKIEKNYKKGGIATQEDVQSGVETTKVILKEALDVLKRTEENGGLSEEASTVTADGVITRSETGSAEPEMRNGVKVLTAEITIPRGDGNTSIHAHITEGVEMNDDGTASGTTSSALVPGPDDPGIFSKFSQNIIVGRLGEISVSPKTMTQPSRISKPSLGIAIFGNNITTQSKPQVKLTKTAVQKIIE